MSEDLAEEAGFVIPEYPPSSADVGQDGVEGTFEGGNPLSSGTIDAEDSFSSLWNHGSAQENESVSSDDIKVFCVIKITKTAVLNYNVVTILTSFRF